MTACIHDMTDDVPYPTDSARTFILLLDYLIARRRKRAIGDKLRRQMAPHAKAIAQQLCRRIEHARRQDDAQTALTLFEVMVALALPSALSASNLRWIIREADLRGGTSASRQEATELALSHWLYGNGPVDPHIVALAEAKQRERPSNKLNRLLLWIEPTPRRWRQLAEGVWSAYRHEHGVQGFDRDRDVELVDRFAPHDRSPMRVLQETGEPGRAALREAARQSGPAKAILSEWVQRDEADGWAVR